MGAYQIFKIEFKEKKVRDFFENLEFKSRRLFQYKNGEEYNCVYYMGWDGYGLGGICLDKLKKRKMLDKIKSFKSIDLTCGTNWYNELKNYIKKN